MPANDSFPAPVYAETVLGPNFEDAKQHYIDALIEIHYAHTRMLACQGILTAGEARALIAALDGLDPEKIARAPYDGACEDLFFYIEGLLQDACGELAGKMHTARSRNDIAITLYRMTVRRELLALAAAIAHVRSVLLDMAGRHLETVMPAHTHTQPAQPTTLAHYLLAGAEFLARDAARIQAAFARVNLCPLGACAITTTAFPIDRHITARLLGFEGLAENSYGAIAAIDYLTESAATVAVAMVNLGKLVQDLLLWSTREFGFLRLSEAFVQCSSIMPQKRNPVALEHTRILASRALGEAQALFTCVHNTPFGDINDSEDDLQPLAFTMFGNALRALRLLAGVLRSAEVDRDRLARRAAADFLTVTELADTLVRREGLSFRDAHAMVSRAVQASAGDDRPGAIAAVLLNQNPSLRLTRDELERALDPENFVRTRRVVGGPAPEVVAESLSRARQEQARITEWTRAKESLLEAAHRQNRAPQ
ncbi:Argininosuccinate lyase 2 [Candidatus Sulfopaludibacter sp. SbA4]|nr:Argininosuccinate lyase 2 [Candidatus Sulfopaludibacter sp. SbA4]